MISIKDFFKSNVHEKPNEIIHGKIPGFPWAYLIRWVYDAEANLEGWEDVLYTYE